MDKDYIFEEHDFELAQENKVIKDAKLEAKPTTFLKDAVRRFAKNKASVACGIILGILILMAIFVPVFSNHNIDDVSSPEKFIAPKLFKTGTGFWDGTYKYEDIVYDPIEEVPAGYTKSAVVEGTLVLKDIEYYDQASDYGHNGYVVFASDTKEVTEGDDKIRFLQTYSTTYTSTGNYKVNISLLNKDNVQESSLGEYRIIIKDSNELVLKDWSKDYSENIEIDISKAISDAGLTKVTGEFAFQIKSSAANYTYILIKSVKFTCNDNLDNYDLLVNTYSFEDATQMVKQSYKTRTSNDDEELNQKYWNCNGRKGIHNSEVIRCDFRYDTYEAVYGKTTITVDPTKLKAEMDKGGFTYSYNKKTQTFTYEITDPEKCAFQEVLVDKMVINSRTKELLSVDVVAYKYYSYGYDEMPTYILGTDLNGQDLFVKAFAGLRTSLIIGVLTAAFCFTFGLIWGSISGYFGGNVDLAMERFCEILSGVPFIVVMTLAMLHLGRNLVTFWMALCLTGWMGTSGRTRAQFYRFKGREYVLASRTLGASDMRLIFKHILPNSLGTIITGAVLMIPSTIFSEASLAYLNLGLQGTHSFGVMMSDNQPYLHLYPTVVIFPAVVMALIMISFNLFGNGLRDAFNPSLKGSE